MASGCDHEVIELRLLYNGSTCDNEVIVLLLLANGSICSHGRSIVGLSLLYIGGYPCPCFPRTTVPCFGFVLCLPPRLCFLVRPVVFLISCNSIASMLRKRPTSSRKSSSLVSICREVPGCLLSLITPPSMIVFLGLPCTANVSLKSFRRAEFRKPIVSSFLSSIVPDSCFPLFKN